MKKLSIDEIKYRIGEMYPGEYFDFSGYKNTNSKIRGVDIDYGEWFPTVKNLLRNRIKHTKRAINERKSTSITICEVIDRIKNVHGDTVKIDESTYVNTNVKCRFVDIDYGEFFAIPYHIFNGVRNNSRAIEESSKKRILLVKDIKKRLALVHNNKVTICESTYNKASDYADFIHVKYGTWRANVNNVLRGSSHPNGQQEKSISTSIANYGVPYPMQNYDVFKKAQKSRWETISLLHWKTNKEVLCRGSYEYAVVKYLNNNKIDFDWQIKFILNNNIVYYIDLFLKKDNKYVEIKGIFHSKRNFNKWSEFHKLYKNSELWQENKVIFLFGKSRYFLEKEFKHEVNKTK